MTIKHGLLFKIVLAITFIILVMFATTRVASQIATQTGDVINVEASFLDMAFFSADEVRLKVSSNDDVFAAGGSIKVDETTADHLVLAGGEINIKDIVVDDVFAAGGDLNMRSGSVTDDLLAGGRTVTLYPPFQVSGSAIVSGGEITINASIGEELRVAANHIVLNSAVKGNVKLMGDQIELGPEARIGGNLQYRGDNIVISPKAVIAGTKSVLPSEEHDEFERWGKGSAALFVGFAIAALLGITVLVVIVVLILPGLMNAASRMIWKKPLLSAGIGFLTVFILPIALIVLFATIVGAPLAMLVAAMLFAFTPIAVAASAYSIGMKGRQIITKKTDDVPALSVRLLWSAIAIVLILLLGIVPFVGGFIWLLVLMFGMGAIIVQGGMALGREI